LHESGLLPRDARLLVAVSGGADSVALLRLLVAINGSAYWNWRLEVVHVDHGIRGRESAADARFVRTLARTFKLKCRVKKLTLPKTASEDAARQARLAAFRGVARVRGSAPCHGVVTAHHADDQAETLLMRIMRGTGIDGLAGIAPDATVRGVRLLRPLLNIRRRELQKWLAEIRQGWREDATNASVRYLRNRVRHTVMPMLNVLWPRGVDAIGRLARLAADAQQLLDLEVAAQLAAHPVVQHKSAILMNRTMLRTAPPAVASEILRQTIESAGGSRQSADYERIAEALRLARTRIGGKKIEAGAGITIHFDGDVVRVERP
jgi:tRNA(Ile)-lysidine synthase